MTTNTVDLDKLFDITHAVTGLSEDDLLALALATTPEETTAAFSNNTRKMTAHIKNVPLSTLPNFIKYPKTGFPPDRST